MTRQGSRQKALTPVLVLAAVVTMLALSGPGEVGADPPKPDGAKCRTNQSCQSRTCVKVGTQKFGTCQTPAPETCNGVDDDFDGTIDEGYVPEETTCIRGTFGPLLHLYRDDGLHGRRGGGYLPEGARRQCV